MSMPISSAKSKITGEILVAAGLAAKSRDGVRLLAKGALTTKVELEVAGASKTAIEALERRARNAKNEPFTWRC